MRNRRKHWSTLSGNSVGGQLPLKNSPLRGKSRRGPGAFRRAPEHISRAGRRDRPVGELPSIGLRVVILSGMAVVVFAIILFRLWFLQILSGQQYVAKANENRLRTVRIAAPRGLIQDRNGTTLVSNKPGLAVGIRLMAVPDGRLAAVLNSLAAVLREKPAAVRETLARHVGYGVIAVKQGLDSQAMERVRQTMGTKSGIEVDKGTVSVTLVAVPKGEMWSTLVRLSAVVSVPADELYETLVRRAGHEYDLVTVKEDVTARVRGAVLERRASFPGVEVAAVSLRDYRFNSLAAHILGNVGEINAEQLKQANFAGLRAGDIIGQGGVEYTYDSWLRGRDGEARVEVDSSGRPKGAVAGGVSERPGNTLVLSIDAGVQKAAEKALAYGIRLAHDSGKWRADGGSAVVMNVQTGEIVALASNPSYPPDIWENGLSNKEMSTYINGANHPFSNKADQGTYAPGSTFKPISAIAALEEGMVTPYSTFNCTGSYKNHGQTFKCWLWPDKHGQVNMFNALAESCDVYFYNLGFAFFNSESTPLANWAARFGLGRLTGIDLPGEADGLVPTPEWREQYFKNSPDPGDTKWRPGDSIQFAIGQGDLAVTPLQMAVAYAAIANGGYVVTPHVGLEVKDAAGRPLMQVATPASRRLDVAQNDLDVVRTGLRMAANSGIGTSSPVFQGYPVTVAGKTGTAEKAGQDDSAWYASYAPAGDPKYVVVVMIEQGGHGGTAAAPAARMIYDALFNIQGGHVLGNLNSD